MAKETPEQVTALFFFGCNVDPSGAKPFVYTDVIGRCLERHKKDYAELSPTPDGFDRMSEGLQLMQRDQPNYDADDLASITVTVTVAQAENGRSRSPASACGSPPSRGGASRNPSGAAGGWR